MKIILLALSACFLVKGFGQKGETEGQKTLLAELAENSCKCVDSIRVADKAKKEISREINRCINLQTGAYQLGSKFMNLDSLGKKAKGKNGKKEIDISINMNEDSREYKRFYYEIERYMMDNCEALKEKIASNDKQNEKSYSDNREAVALYTKGVDEAQKGNYKKAVENYEKAVEIDPEFAFAWDNMGLAFRKLEDYDKALAAYNKSLEIDPYGLMPLQNIAIVYRYKKEYDKAIEAYERLAAIDKTNPEVYFGIGQIHTAFLNDHEKGLDNMCKAYNLYIEQKSPYRTDAEKMIQYIYSAMKKDGKEEKFNEILKQHNISTQ
jgi:tetratricopeptide (TPR) repeat protein